MNKTKHARPTARRLVRNRHASELDPAFEPKIGGKACQDRKH
jgi:hypothetical protein